MATIGGVGGGGYSLVDTSGQIFTGSGKTQTSFFRFSKSMKRMSL